MTYKEKLSELQNEVNLCQEAFFKAHNEVNQLNGFGDITLPGRYSIEYKKLQQAILNYQNFLNYIMKVNAQPDDIFTIDTILEKLTVHYKLTPFITFKNGISGRYGVNEIDTNLQTVELTTPKGLKELLEYSNSRRNAFQEVLAEEENAIIAANLIIAPFADIEDVQ